MKILENVQKYLEKCKPNKTSQNEAESSKICSNEPISPSAPLLDSLVQEYFEVECVVCMTSQVCDQYLYSLHIMMINLYYIILYFSCDFQCSVVFLPCGHVCCCPVCASLLRNCPLCRADISQTVDTSAAASFPFSFQSAL